MSRLVQPTAPCRLRLRRSDFEDLVLASERLAADRARPGLQLTEPHYTVLANALMPTRDEHMSSWIDHTNHALLPLGPSALLAVAPACDFHQPALLLAQLLQLLACLISLTLPPDLRPTLNFKTNKAVVSKTMRNWTRLVRNVLIEVGGAGLACTCAAAAYRRRPFRVHRQ